MKKNLVRFCIVALLLSAVACDYTPNRSNIIASSRNVIDTGVRYMIVQRDTSQPLPEKKPDTPAVKKTDSVVIVKKQDTIIPPPKLPEPAKQKTPPKVALLIDYAKTMVGQPYSYGENTPGKGFSNSGFVNRVFRHFEIEVPKYAPAFIAVGQSIAAEKAAPGDIILFSKTDTEKKAVFQVGIVVSTEPAPLSFIHASSGKMNGVGISTLTPYYQKKVMGYRRVF